VRRAKRIARFGKKEFATLLFRDAYMRPSGFSATRNAACAHRGTAAPIARTARGRGNKTHKKTNP
jgi:hypothetical protein